MNHPPRVLTISVGNTRTRAGVFESGQLADSAAFPSASQTEAREVFTRLLGSSPDPTPAVLASVNDPAATDIASVLTQLNHAQPPARLGRDLPIPIRHSLDDDSTVGQDRLLNAIAAFARAKQACVVIDAGTAVTVDFIDGEGVFHGGIIFPGLRLMLRALHDGTAALPELPFTPPDPARGPLGKDTAHAMTLGVITALRGAVRMQVERTADFYGAYPQVIATGGDAHILEEEDSIVEHFVPDLPLVGLYECIIREPADEDDDE